MKLKYKKTIFLLDADGTITDLKTKKPNQELLCRLGNFLDGGGKIAIVTGRTLKWVEKTVITELVKKNKFASDIIIVAEFGAVSKHKEGNRYVVGEDKKHFLNPTIRTKLNNLASKYKESMFVDLEKKSMFTVEMRDNYSFEAFARQRDLLEKDIKKLLSEDRNLFINPSSIALDVRKKILNKYLATQKALNLLKVKSNNKVIAVGDNRFDSEMAEEAYKGNRDTLFVYLGKDSLSKKLDFPVFLPKNRYTEGFLEFLNEYGY